MRVLFICHRFPGAEPRGDQLRAYQQIRELAQRHRITLLCAESIPPEHPVYQEMHGLCERVLMVPRAPVAMALRALTAIWRDRPLQVAMFDAGALRKAVTELRARQSFDLVHLQLARLDGLIDACVGLPVLVDLIDALSLNMQRRSERGSRWLRPLLRLEAARLRRLEHRLRERAHTLVVCAEHDARHLGATDQVQVVGNGVDLARFPFRDDHRARRDLLFVGNLGYFPNLDALRWLLIDVWPRLRARHPGLSLNIVGARPPAELRRLTSGQPGVDLIGEVDEVYPYYANARLALAPMRAGSGQLLKILEAMAAGAPVVATSLAAQGLDAETRAAVSLADGADAQVAAIEALLADPDRCAAQSAEARRLVARNYSWTVSNQRLEQLWQATAERKT